MNMSAKPRVYVTRRIPNEGMRLLYTSRSRNEALEGELGLHYVSLNDLLAQSNFVSLHTPLTDETRRLMDATRLARMKPGSILINTARGPIVDTDALVEASRAGPLAAAALDVTDPEPLPASHPIFALPNALITPHMASASHAARGAMAIRAAQNLLAGLNGEPLVSAVNPEALGHGRSQAPRPWANPPGK